MLRERERADGPAIDSLRSLAIGFVVVPGALAGRDRPCERDLIRRRPSDSVALLELLSLLLVVAGGDDEGLAPAGLFSAGVERCKGDEKRSERVRTVEGLSFCCYSRDLVERREEKRSGALRVREE